MNNAKAFAPSHISGFFIPKITKKTGTSGSIGAGVCLEDGITAEITHSRKSRITLNNKPFQCNPLQDTIHAFTDEPLKIELVSSVPIGAGFGTSGASLLATALAANQLLELNLTKNQLTQTAHTAEVTNKTGLGDIPAQVTGGIVIRLKQGAPPYAIVDQIPTGKMAVSWVSFKGISTRKILEDASLQKQIITSGKKALKNLLRKPTPGNFMVQSSKFTRELGLASSQVVDAIESAQAQGITAAQAMLGETVFAIGEDVFSEYKNSNTSRVNHTGAILL